MRFRNKLSALLLTTFALNSFAGVPDSVYVRPTFDKNGGGLFLEWSSNGVQWKNATSSRVLGSDFGAWGSSKKLYTPSICRGADDLIALVFSMNSTTNQFGVATTKDFIHWRPQDYPYMKGAGQCLEPVINYADGTYTVTFHNAKGECFSTRSSDLVHFTDPVASSAAEVSVVRVPYRLVQGLSDNQVAFSVRDARQSELARDDESRFADVKDVTAEVRISDAKPLKISDKLMGIFFEDINYAADGGLNAQLIQNGDFEYDPHDRMGDRHWNPQTAWTKSGNLKVETLTDGVSEMNSNCLGVTVDESTVGNTLSNDGFNGIVLKRGAKYDLSLYLRGQKGGKVEIAIGSAIVKLTVKNNEWKQYKATVTAKEDKKDAALAVKFLTPGVYAIDMVSLMPQDTYKGHGVRRDLAEALEALHPRFMRFPGGCLVHGDGLGNMYNWKETIGDLKDRKPLRNIWNYHQSRQMGYYEFFQFCEDMNMEPLPVVAAGVPCQNSTDGGHGQQGGIPMEDMPEYVQDVLDLIEWANGDPSTEWGAKRVAQGHKKPFNLKMIGIGNEDLISPTFEERYLMICKAVHEKYPEIEICGTAGPFYYGSDYEEGWRIANENKDVISLVDEHYYVSPGWYIWNQDYYDHYDRNAPKVYLGEWAAHGPGRKSTIETALACAMHYCSLERNGDVVVMSSYAPLLARNGHTQWNPDMIYFDGSEVFPTVDYYGQMMCGQAAGDEYLASTIHSDDRTTGLNERLAVSTVRDSKTGKTYVKLVNLLPRDVKAQMKFEGLLTAEKVCKTTTLTGKFDSTSAKPKEGTATLSPECEVVLPAYSFTVIEL